MSRKPKREKSSKVIHKAPALITEEEERQLIIAGIAYHNSGKLPEAEKLYESILKLHPGSADTLYLLGTLFLQTGRRDAGIDKITAALALKPGNPAALNNLGSALQEQGRFDEAVARYTEALRLKPGFPEALNNLGNALKELGRLDEAVARFSEALRLKPDYPEALNNLGNVLKELGRLDEAATRFSEALRLRPGFPEALNNLGIARRGQGRLDEAVARYAEALRLRPDYPEALNNLGSALQEQGRLTEAFARYAEALRLAPDYPDAHWNDGLARLLTGDFEAGWPQYEWRWKRSAVRPHGLPHPLWDGSELNGRTILLHCEQGFGDSLQFVRYVKLVKNRGGTVILLCPSPLRRLFQSVAGHDRLATRVDEIPACDVQAPLLSLPAILKTTAATIPAEIPYLSPEAPLVAKWRQRLEGLAGLKVGVVWQGHPGHKNDRNRSIAPELFAKLLEERGCSFVNLQKPEPGASREAPGPSGNLLDLGNGLEDFAETAAIVANLDLVISVDTAVAHLAGAMGKPAWVLLPFAPDWRWQIGRDDSPWYPTLRLFRQPAAGDWSPTIRAVADRLREETEFSRHSRL